MEWGGEWDNCNSIINKYIYKKRSVTVKGQSLSHFAAASPLGFSVQPQGSEDRGVQPELSSGVAPYQLVTSGWLLNCSKSQFQLL